MTDHEKAEKIALAFYKLEIEYKDEGRYHDAMTVIHVALQLSQESAAKLYDLLTDERDAA